jgi:transposase-like protein
MPRKNETKLPPNLILEVVKRHIEGREHVGSLAKEYGVGRASVYNWVDRYEKNSVSHASKEYMEPHQIESAEKTVLIAEVKRLKAELDETRSKLVARMIKLGEL